MVRTSEQFGGRLNAVNREGYRELHLRVSKALSVTFDLEGAQAIANKDWAEDITAFSGDSKDLVWLEEVKKKFLAAASARVAALGWQALFDIYDADRSGELDVDEFVHAVRTECSAGGAAFELEDAQLLDVFGQVGGGGSHTPHRVNTMMKLFR
jgi:hypothetical protein